MRIRSVRLLAGGLATILSLSSLSTTAVFAEEYEEEVAAVETSAAPEEVSYEEPSCVESYSEEPAAQDESLTPAVEEVEAQIPAVEIPVQDQFIPEGLSAPAAAPVAEFAAAPVAEPVAAPK